MGTTGRCSRVTVTRAAPGGQSATGPRPTWTGLEGARPGRTETWGWAPPGHAWPSPAPNGCWRVRCERRAHGHRDACGPHLVAQPGRMRGRLERRDARGAGPTAVKATPTSLRIGGRPPASPTPPLCPVPRALADLAGAGALHSEARGGAGPPHTAALRHESPTLPGTLGQGRGAHSLYLAGLDLFCGSLQSPHPVHLLVPPFWFGGWGLSFPYFLVFPALCHQF